MVSTTVVITLLVFLPAIITGKQSISDSKELKNNDCVCISRNYGCPADREQTGKCDKRCCPAKDPVTGERSTKKCACMNVPKCPPDMPNEIGKCNDLIECCRTSRNKRHEF